MVDSDGAGGDGFDSLSSYVDDCPLVSRCVMSCLCGDVCCSSCGPAQGNWRCPICRAWSSEGCEHLDDNGIKPEYVEQCEAIAKAERDADEQYARWILESENLT